MWCIYRTPDEERLRFYPVFCPLACFCPCGMLGRIKSVLEREKEWCCGMGCQGWLCCCVSTVCLCPGQMILSASLRSDIAREYKVTTTICDTCKGCCVPCSIFQVFVSLEYWLSQPIASPPRPQLPAPSTSNGSREPPPRMNTVTAVVLSHIGNETLSFESARPLSTELSPVTDTSSTLPPPPDKPNNTNRMRIKIPPDHFAGSKFEVEGSNGETTLVVVPEGGKPGMVLEIEL